MLLAEALKLWRKFEAQTTQEQAVELYEAVINTPKGAVVEVGSASGGTTVILIAAAEEVNKVVYSIDPYPENLEGVATYYTPGIMKTFKEQFKRNILEGPWKNIIQYREELETCFDKLPKDLSVVFIDGCHEFSYVYKETNLLFSQLVSKGLLYIHDVEWDAGQVSNTKESGVSQIYNRINGFSDVKTVISSSGAKMLCISRNIQ